MPRLRRSALAWARASAAGLALLLDAACAPDRFYVEGTRGWGSIDPSDKLGEYDTEGDALTLGLSFPLGSPQERIVVERYIMASPMSASPSGAPIASGEEEAEIPWTEILFMAAGALGMETSRRGYGKIQTVRSQKREAKKTPTTRVETS